MSLLEEKLLVEILRTLAENIIAKEWIVLEGWGSWVVQSSEDFHCQAGQWPDDTGAGKWSIGTNGRKYIEKIKILTFITFGAFSFTSYFDILWFVMIVFVHHLHLDQLKWACATFGIYRCVFHPTTGTSENSTSMLYLREERSSFHTYSTTVLHPSLTCYILPIKCSIVLGRCFLHPFLLWPRMPVLYLDLIWWPVCCPLYWPIVGWLLQIFTSSFGTWVILVTHLSATVLSGGIPSTSSLLTLLLTAMKTFSSAISTPPPCHHNNIQLGAFCGCVTQWKDRQAAILLGTKSNLSLACFTLLACQPFRVWDEPKLLWEYWLAPPLPNVNPPTIPPIPLSCVSPIPSSVRPSPLPSAGSYPAVARESLGLGVAWIGGPGAGWTCHSSWTLSQGGTAAAS